MRVTYISVLFAVFAVRSKAAYVVQCDQLRSADDPAGTLIANALAKGIEASVSQYRGDHAIFGEAFIHEHGSATFKITSQNAAAYTHEAEPVFSAIVTDCVEQGNFWGGSVTAAGYTYQIYNNAYAQSSTGNLQRRAKPKPKSKTTKAAPPKTTKPTTTKTSKAATLPNTSKVATSPKPSSSLKESSTKSSSSVVASSTANFANKCAQIGRRDTEGQLPERRDLEDMGFVTRDLHDLLVKRGKKSGTGCGIKLAADDYPSYSKISTVKAWGWDVPDSCSNYSWGGPLKKQAPKSQTTYESEHVLEWQTITGFLDYVNRLPAYQVKEDDNGVTRKTYNFFTHPDPAMNGKKIDFCQYFNATWAPLEKDVTFKVGNGEKLSAWKNLAAEYPSNNNYKHEFILLQKNINAPTKANLWNTNAIYADMKVKGKTVDNARETLQRVRRIIGALKYHTHTEIQDKLKSQKQRIGDRFDAIEKELPSNSRNGIVNGQPTPFAAYQGQNLKAKWDTYMDDMFNKAKAKAKQYIEDGIKDLKAEFLTATKIQEAKPDAKDTKAKKEERENLADFQKNIKDLEASYKTVADWKKPW